MNMQAITFPPFPEDVPTHPLLVIDYQLIKSRDEKEFNRLWEAGTKLGFWYLKNHGIDQEINEMFNMGAETMDLPLEEKLKFDQGNSGKSFGYKAAGASVVDKDGQLSTAEFLNVAKDDAIAWPRKVHREYPGTVNARMGLTITSFVRKSVEVNDTILEIFNDRVGLPSHTLLKLHSMEEPSGSEVRIIKNPATSSETKLVLSSHTDFGSLSIVHNRLGGLQVLVPSSDAWQYVKPIEGHAICNVGDALSILTGGILRSNMHRVLPPPGAQANLERWSLVFFTRPGNSVVMRSLVNESSMIAESVMRSPGQNFNTGSTAEEWFSRRVKARRLHNWKGPETWKAGLGTEHAQN